MIELPSKQDFEKFKKQALQNREKLIKTYKQFLKMRKFPKAFGGQEIPIELIYASAKEMGIKKEELE